MSQKPQKNLTNRQLDILSGFRYGKDYPISEISHFAHVADISLATLKRDISGLILVGFLDKKGEKRTGRYALSDAGLLLRHFDVDNYPENVKYQKTLLPTYNFNILNALDSVALFTQEEIEKLDAATAHYKSKAQHASPTISKKELERFVIELSWKSSKIEGNTYTLLDTERLLREGIVSKTNTKEETIMILNHKKAFSYILSLKESGRKISHFSELENIHKLLVEGLGINHGIRKGEVGITGTKYVPLSIPAQIEEEIKNMLGVICKKHENYSKALIALLCSNYIQPFEDGNKRTARLFANALLLEDICAPLSYRDVDEKLYREAVLIFYEQNSIEAFKKIFIEQYIFSCNTYNIANM